ncbi:MAG: LytR C-terminal domain-containing protein [Solirubrobacterales bacterium]
MADALVVASIVERLGAYVGFLALVGLAILALLYFSQARDVRRLREWAGRAPERAAEAEQRAAQVLAQPQQQAVVRRAAAPAATAGAASATATAASPSAPATAAGRAAVAGTTQTAAGPGRVAEGEQAAPPEQAETEGESLEQEELEAEPGHELEEQGQEQGQEQEIVPEADGLDYEEVEQDEEAIVAATGGNAHAVTDQPTVAQESLQPLAPEHYLPGTAYRDASPRRRKPLRRRLRNIYIPQLRYIVAGVAVAALFVLGVGSIAGVIDIGGGSDESGGKSKKAQGPQQSGQAANVDPSQVTVAVLNGTTVTGLAYRVSQEAESSGFTLGNVTNAATTDQQGSEVLYAPGQKGAARAVADRLGISTVTPVDSVNAEIAGSADAVVLVGADRSE